jgi:hypothetical protein
MVRPLIQGASKVAVALGTSRLDDQEVETGTQAWAALLYQYGAQMDARVLVLLWVAGVSIPRVSEYFETRAKAARKVQVENGPVVDGTVKR